MVWNSADHLLCFIRIRYFISSINHFVLQIIKQHRFIKIYIYTHIHIDLKRNSICSSWSLPSLSFSHSSFISTSPRSWKSRSLHSKFRSTTWFTSSRWWRWWRTGGWEENRWYWSGRTSHHGRREEDEKYTRRVFSSKAEINIIWMENHRSHLRKYISPLSSSLLVDSNRILAQWLVSISNNVFINE